MTEEQAEALLLTVFRRVPMLMIRDRVEHHRSSANAWMDLRARNDYPHEYGIEQPVPGPEPEPEEEPRTIYTRLLEDE